jgi:succinoglycan biosynthesis protein ExoO
MPDKITIVMPAYNAEPFVEDAVRSALTQTYPDFELIVVDDNSNDRTKDVVASISDSDPRVMLICCEQTGGPGRARNHGLGAASGSWIALLDADDIYASDHLETLLRAGKAHDCDMVAGNQLLRAFPGEEDLGLAFPELTETRELTLNGLVTSGLTPGTALSYGFLKPLISRQFIATHQIRYDENRRVGEDFLFYFDCMSRRAKCLLIPQASYIYRRRNESLTLSDANNYRILSDLTGQIIKESKHGASDELIALLEERKKYLDEQSMYVETVSLLRQRRFLRGAQRMIARPRIGARLAGKAIGKLGWAGRSEN